VRRNICSAPLPLFEEKYEGNHAGAQSPQPAFALTYIEPGLRRDVTSATVTALEAENNFGVGPR
jgi:hypothetical protein